MCSPNQIGQNIQNMFTTLSIMILSFQCQCHYSDSKGFFTMESTSRQSCCKCPVCQSDIKHQPNCIQQSKHFIFAFSVTWEFLDCFARASHDLDEGLMGWFLGVLISWSHHPCPEHWTVKTWRRSPWCPAPSSSWPSWLSCGWSSLQVGPSSWPRAATAEIPLPPEELKFSCFNWFHKKDNWNV